MVYKEIVESKVWVLRLKMIGHERGPGGMIAAVDRDTGVHIANLIEFRYGSIRCKDGAMRALEEKGYDPGLYDFEWGDLGRLVIGHE